jgi:anti-sigma regulatory factor (Ser/Thr protein kinase)
MPGMTGLELLERVQARFPFVPVILTTAQGSEDLATWALKKGAAAYLPQRRLEEELLPTVEQVLDRSMAERARQQVLSSLTQAEYHFVLDNDPALIPPLIRHLEENIGWLEIWDEKEITRVCVAVREALLNAIYHGNLELKKDPPEPDTILGLHGEAANPELEDPFFYLSVMGNMDLIEQRRHQEPYRDRKVHFHAKIGRSKAEFTIRDGGSGFDPGLVPDPTDPANLEKARGRGLLLIRMYMDQVKHNKIGNEVTMMKKCVRAGQYDI